MSTLFGKYEILNRIQSFLEKGKIDSAIPDTTITQSSRSIWEEMLDIGDHMQWSHEEANILLASEKCKSFCHAKFKDSDLTGQSVIIGFDLKANQLLIDELFPVPTPKLLEQGFELTLRGSQGLLVLKVEIKEKVYLESQPALLLRILAKNKVDDRRRKPRIQFSRNTAPKIELFVPLSGTVQGHLLDLSTEGLSMVIFGPKKPYLITTSGECSLHLSEHIKVKARIRIKQVNYNRKPNNHTTIRVVFTQASDTQNDQVSAFIQSFEALRNRAA